VLFGANDITAGGTLPLILSDISPEDRVKIEKALKEEFKGRITSELPLVNGFTVEISPKKLQQFTKLLSPDANVRVDSKLRFPDPQSLIPLPDTKGPKDETDAKNVYIETLGIQKLWDKGYTGKGVGVCVIDSGIESHDDFGGRVTGWKDMSGDKKESNYDPFGHGTHVSGIIGGSGAASEGKIKGVAPDCNLIGVRITCVSEAIKAIQWAIENKEKEGIDILNMSLGDYAIKSYKDDPWAQASEKAIDAGLIVVVAAGNEGPGEKSVSTPGIDPRVITVGAYDDRKTPGTGDDTIYENSSRGPTTMDNITKPDLLGPGVKMYSTLSPGSTLDIADMPHIGARYIEMTGTSMATPVIAGVCAILKSADRTLTHDRVKTLLKETAVKMPELDDNAQGAGRVDPLAAAEKLEKGTVLAKAPADAVISPEPPVALASNSADGWNFG
jgi:serine protease AprX